jgi:radical SAM superfamily enzyme YgiQ (UPF0313 family)
MRIALISAASVADPLRKQEPMMPLSLPALAASAPGHDYELFDCLWDDRIEPGAPLDLAGISIRLHGEQRAIDLARRFRSQGVPVVFGGPQASARPHELLEHADAIAVGEGEPLWPRIVDDAAGNRLRRFYVCSHRPFDSRGKSAFVLHPDPALQVAPAARHLFKRRYLFDTVFASRGCPIDCDFCSVTHLFGSRVRTRPVDDVIAEIRTFRRYYYLLDDTVFGRPPVYDYYLELYDKIARIRPRKFWIGQANLDAAATEAGREVIRAAARAGLAYVSVGIESINPDTLAASGAAKKIGQTDKPAIDTIRERIRFIQEQGILVSGWFVVGYETDTIETFDACRAFCEEMHIFPVIFPVRALPGTRLYDRSLAAGMIADPRTGSLRHAAMTESMITEALGRIGRQGYRFGVIARRLAHAWPYFPDNRVHRAIFGFMTQRKLRRAADILHRDYYKTR